MVGLELQSEFHAWIEKACDRRERNQDWMRLAGEFQEQAEEIWIDLKIPELMFEHDRHLVGITIGEMIGDDHARRARAKRDVEMVLARKAARTCGLLQSCAHNAPKGFLHQRVVP